MRKTIISNSAKESRLLGERIGKQLKGGEIFVLSGNLGSGKTTFLQGLAFGLGVLAKVNSPTFNILKLYQIKKGKLIKTFCHIDAYRLNSASEIISLGFKDLLEQTDLVIAIEWSENIKEALPKSLTGRIIKIEFKHQTENSRAIKIETEQKILF